MPDMNMGTGSLALAESCKSDLPPSDRKHIADLLWQTIANVEKGQTAYWTVEQLKHIARIAEPLFNKPINLEIS